MMTIWKFPLSVGPQKVEMPAGAELLTVQMQDEQSMLWVRVDTTQPKTERILSVVGTGHEAPHPRARYVATFQMGWMVWHVFDHGQSVHAK